MYRGTSNVSEESLYKLRCLFRYSDFGGLPIPGDEPTKYEEPVELDGFEVVKRSLFGQCAVIPLECLHFGHELLKPEIEIVVKFLALVTPRTRK